MEFGLIHLFQINCSELTLAWGFFTKAGEALPDSCRNYHLVRGRDGRGSGGRRHRPIKMSESGRSINGTNHKYDTYPGTLFNSWTSVEMRIAVIRAATSIWRSLRSEQNANSVFLNGAASPEQTCTRLLLFVFIAISHIAFWRIPGGSHHEKISTDRPVPTKVLPTFLDYLSTHAKKNQSSSIYKTPLPNHSHRYYNLFKSFHFTIHQKRNIWIRDEKC